MRVSFYYRFVSLGLVCLAWLGCVAVLAFVGWLASFYSFVVQRDGSEWLDGVGMARDWLIGCK